VGDEKVKEKCMVLTEEKGEEVTASCRANRPVSILQNINSLPAVGLLLNYFGLKELIDCETPEPYV